MGLGLKSKHTFYNLQKNFENNKINVPPNGVGLQILTNVSLYPLPYFVFYSTDNPKSDDKTHGTFNMPRGRKSDAKDGKLDKEATKIPVL